MLFLLPIIQEIEADGSTPPMFHMNEKKKVTAKMMGDIRSEICKLYNLDMDGYAEMLGVSKVTVKVMEKIDDYDRKDKETRKYIKGVRMCLSIIEQPLFSNISNEVLRRCLK